MSTSMSAQTSDQDGFTAETFAQFWAAPVLSDTAVSPIAEEVTGYWPGDDEPLRGRDAYVQAGRPLGTLTPGTTGRIRLDGMLEENATDSVAVALAGCV